MNVQKVGEGSSRRNSFEKSSSSPELLSIVDKSLIVEESSYRDDFLLDKDIYPFSGQMLFPKINRKRKKIKEKKQSKKIIQEKFILQIRKRSLGEFHRTHIEELIQVLDEVLEDLNIENHLKNLLKELITRFVFEENSSEIIGTIIYFLDSNPKEFFKLINFDNLKDTLNLLHEEIGKVIYKLKWRVHLHYENHLKTGIQNAPICMQNFLCYQIANLLLTKKGLINFGLIPLIFSKVISQQFPLLNYEYRIFYALLLLENSQELRKKINDLELPIFKHSLSASIIKTQVQKKNHEIVTLRDTRLTALTALMSHLRQGPVGSCFATQMAIILLSSHLKQCINDFHLLLKNSKLTRNVGVVKKDFPFLLKIGDNDTSKTFNIDKEGKVLKKEAFLWENPGILSACNSLGIEDPMGAILDILEELCLIKNVNSFEFCIDKILLLLTEYQIKQNFFSESLKMKYISLAQFAFESQTRNGLLTAWENSLAEMAEGKEKSMIRPAVLNSIFSPLFKKIKSDLSKEVTKESMRVYFKIFHSHLNQRLHLHYDPKINKMNNLCKIMSEGGYIIYDKGGDKDYHEWLRIDSPDKFSKFSQAIFKTTYLEFLELIGNIQKINQEKYYDEIREYLGSFKYQIDALLTYYPQYINEEKLIERWEELQYTPWRTLSGNLAIRVREVYMEDENTTEMIPLKPLNAKILLFQLITFFYSLSQEEQEAFRKNPHKKIPIISTNHAFSLILGHPSFLEIIDSQLTFKAWLDKKFNPILNKLQNTLVTLETQFDLINLFSEKISIKNKISLSRYTYADLRKELMLCIKNSELNTNEKEFNEWIYTLDKEIFERLPFSIKDEISTHTIHFADINWRHISDIHFGITLNPCTNKFAIFEINDDGEGIKIINNNWLKEEWHLPYVGKNFLPLNDF